MIDILDRIEYSITDQCNLNCAYCCHYAPIAKKYYVSEKQFYSDIKRLSKLTMQGKALGTLGLLGGEPLLHPKFIEFCVYARKMLPLSRIRVTTNGLLLKRLTKPALCILHRYDIEILISKYRDADNFDEMAKLLEEYKITYKFCNNNALVNFSKYCLDVNGKQNIVTSHNNCELWKAYYTCHELRDGYLYPCSQIARVDTLNERFNLHLPNKKLSAINIHKNNLNKICEFVKQPCVHCAYCKTSQWNNTVGKWKHSSLSQEEFV